MFINDEYSILKVVVVGIGDKYDLGDVCNTTIQANLDNGRLPTQAEIKQELDCFKQFLLDHGVGVVNPKILDCTPDQTCPRDIGFVVDETFILSNTLVETRKTEFDGVKQFFDQLRVIRMPEGCYLEGGDLIVHGKYLFAGLGERSNLPGINFIKTQFPEKEVIVVEHCGLHLDCCFNILSDKSAIYVPSIIKNQGLQSIEKVFKNLISVELSDQVNLVTNFLQFKPGHIVARDHPSFDRYSCILKKCGFTVYRIKFDAVPRLGGSFRCATLPILRV